MTTGIWSSNYNPPDFAQKSFGLNITRLRPTGMTTLLALTSLFQGETAKQIEHGFWTEALIFPGGSWMQPAKGRAGAFCQRSCW